MRASPLLLILLASAAGCGDDTSASSAAGGGGSSAVGTDAAPSSGPGGSGAGSGSGSGGAATSSASGSTGATSSSGGGGAPPCSAETLAESVRVTPLAISGAASGRAVTAQAGSGSIVAWAGSDGMIHATPLDAVDARAGEDLTVEGAELFGAAATSADVALLFARAPDFMTFVRLDRATGAELARVDLVGGGDHGVEGVEWFYEFARTGRLVAQGDGTFAAYHALHRRWPDGVGHQGDTLRLLDASGGALGGWGWGCSHSMDQRLAHGPNGLVPICISDCYPGKGIYFNHQQMQITDDPAANCAGGFSTRLGGLVATQGGFVLVYQDADGGGHLGVFDAGGAELSDRPLTVEGSSRLAAYGDGLLLGSQGAGGVRLQRLDADGADGGEPVEVAAAPLPEHDFESRTDGEVAWAAAAGAELTVVRARVCD